MEEEVKEEVVEEDEMRARIYLVGLQLCHVDTAVTHMLSTDHLRQLVRVDGAPEEEGW